VIVEPVPAVGDVFDAAIVAVYHVTLTGADRSKLPPPLGSSWRSATNVSGPGALGDGRCVAHGDAVQEPTTKPVDSVTAMVNADARGFAATAFSATGSPR
jgi:hypothetical protein